MQARTGIRVTGKDRAGFLQNLVTNDVEKLKDGLVWTALLTPQGKYFADFFLVPEADAILIDVAAELAPGLLQRLALYKLRASVDLTPVDLEVAQGIGPVPEGAFADPRHPELGWRAYDGRSGSIDDWEARRIANLVPESGIELVPNESYPLEMNFEALNGVDFRKGCYVGQEVTARMKHKTELRKGLAQVRLDRPVPVGTEIVTVAGKSVGTVYSQWDNTGLAYLRFDRTEEPLVAEAAKIEVRNL